MIFDLKKLCPPSLLYFLISIFALLAILFQNLGNKTNYMVGSFSCRVPDVTIIFIIKLIYILFWTWILNLMCKDGHSEISWLFVLFPFLLFFVIIGTAMIKVNKQNRYNR
jgi:hypothetical protein